MTKKEQRKKIVTPTKFFLYFADGLIGVVVVVVVVVDVVVDVVVEVLLFKETQLSLVYIVLIVYLEYLLFGLAVTGVIN